MFENSGNTEKKKEIANKEIYLPMEILVLIISRLSLKDSIRASVICKSWHEAAISIRDRCPWLVYFSINLSGVTYGYFDPREKKKTKAMKINDLSIHASICYSKNGWLLMEDYHEDANLLFFFNPFTREYIKLPSLIASGTEFAFSCAPTNKSCVVCCISNRTPDHFLIHTWYLGESEWVTEEFLGPGPSKFHGKNNIIFSDGYFWFPDRDGLGVFDPTARTWNTLHVPLPNISPFLMWITEYKGNIFLVDVISSSRRKRRLVLFRYNRLLSVWEKKKTFDGLSIFITDESSIVTNGLKGNVSNIVYMWDSHLKTDSQCKYSSYTNSFCSNPDGYCVESSSTNNEMNYGAWIEPPHNSSIYDFPITEPN